MIEVLSYGFMQHALAAALLASLACGIIGALVVVNRLVFLAGGVAHAAYGGVGLSVFLGLPLLPTTLGFSLAGSAVMAAATARGLSRADTAVGALWAAGMAMGIILVELTPGYSADLMSYLFGSILAVSTSDLWLMTGLDALILLLVGALYRPLTAMSYDREFALSRGVPVWIYHYLLVGLIAVAVVLVIRVVGLILVIALLSIPPAMAERHSRSLAGMMIRATLLSGAFCLTGLAVAYTLNLSSGACIIAVAALSFLVWRAWLRFTSR